MLNIHLNGDIVRCPNMVEVQKRVQEIRDKHRLCKYNCHESQCRTWINYIIENKLSGRCVLSGSALCPMRERQRLFGERQKMFKIDQGIYRKMASAAHYLVKESDNKVLFITLTFPKFKRKFTYDELNQAFSRFVENLRTNHNCQGYIAVRENGTNNTFRPHFHLLASIPFIPWDKLNSLWCSAISDICDYSKNAVRSDPKTLFIKNPGRALRYVCKYFAKAKFTSSTSRLVFISNNIIQHHKRFEGRPEDILKGYKGIYINQPNDYCTIYRVTDAADFDKFCSEFLYPLFELYKKPAELYSFSNNSS